MLNILMATTAAQMGILFLIIGYDIVSKDNHIIDKLISILSKSTILSIIVTGIAYYIGVLPMQLLFIAFGLYISLNELHK